MSENTVKALHEAIENHLADIGTEGLVINWIVGWEIMDDEDGFDHGYTVSLGCTPSAAVGLISIVSDYAGTDVIDID